MIKSYKDITILKYQEIMAAIEMNPDSEIAQWYNILPLLTSHPKSRYQQMKFGVFKRIVSRFEWIFTEKMPDQWVKEFTVKGEKFIVVQHATDWIVEQFISMSTLTKDRSQIINNLHKILATLCVKEQGEVVSQTEFERRALLFQEHLNILTAYPIGFFFALFLAKLSGTTQYSSWLETATAYLEMKRKQDHQNYWAKMTSIQPGDGTT